METYICVNMCPLFVYSVYCTWLIGCEGHRAAELIPMAHSGETVHTDFIGAVGLEAWEILCGWWTRGILHLFPDKQTNRKYIRY